MRRLEALTAQIKVSYTKQIEELHLEVVRLTADLQHEHAASGLKEKVVS